MLDRPLETYISKKKLDTKQFFLKGLCKINVFLESCLVKIIRLHAIEKTF